MKVGLGTCFKSIEFVTISIDLVSFCSASELLSISPYTLCVRYVAPERRDESTLDIAAALNNGRTLM